MQGLLFVFLFLPRAKKKAVDAAVERAHCPLSAGVMWLQQKLLHWAYMDRCRHLVPQSAPLALRSLSVSSPPLLPPSTPRNTSQPKCSRGHFSKWGSDFLQTGTLISESVFLFFWHARTEIFAQFFWFITAESWPLKKIQHKFIPDFPPEKVCFFFFIVSSQLLALLRNLLSQFLKLPSLVTRWPRLSQRFQVSHHATPQPCKQTHTQRHTNSRSHTLKKVTLH